MTYIPVKMRDISKVCVHVVAIFAQQFAHSHSMGLIRQLAWSGVGEAFLGVWEEKIGLKW